MKILLKNCEIYADQWKIEFNSNKSFSMSINCSSKTEFFLNKLVIPIANSLIYLGLPLGEDTFTFEFFENKFKSVEKSLHSLRGLGCSYNGTNLRTIAFIYKQFSQSIIKFGLENVHLSEYKLGQLNIRQNILIKNCLKLKRFIRTRALLQVLKIESISHLYLKHKVFFLKQIYNNVLTRDIFIFLKCYFKGKKKPKQSFESQLDQVEKLTKIEPNITNTNSMIDLINGSHKVNDLELISKLIVIVNNFDSDQPFLTIQRLNDLLKLNF